MAFLCKYFDYCIYKTYKYYYITLSLYFENCQAFLGYPVCKNSNQLFFGIQYKENSEYKMIVIIRFYKNSAHHKCIAYIDALEEILLLLSVMRGEIVCLLTVINSFYINHSSVKFPFTDL